MNQTVIARLFDLTGKSALVTGGAVGIGKAIAHRLAQAGAAVLLTDINEETARQAVEEIRQDGGTVEFILADAGSLEDVRRATAFAVEKFGRLDILVNNAGATWGAAIDDYPENGWDKVVDLNMKSVFFMTQKLLPLLRASASAASPARVINIASINGINPTFLETYAYTSSKAGCIMLTRHLAKRLAAENILVNAIAPGPFPSQMMAATLAERGDEVIGEVPLGRIGQPEDIAGVAIFLASRAGAYTTGATIPCDGGAAEV